MVLDIGWNWDFFISWSCTVALDNSLSVGIHKGWMARSKIKRCQRHDWVIYMGNRARHTNVGLFPGNSICWYFDQFDITHLGWKPRRHSLLILLQVISHGCCYASKTLGHTYGSCTVERQHFTSMGFNHAATRGPNIFDRFGNALWQTKWFRHHQNWLKIWAPQSGLKLSAGSFLHIAAIASFVSRKNNYPGFNGLSEPCQRPPKKGLCAARWRGLRPSARGLLLDWPSTAWHRAPWIQKIVDRWWSMGFWFRGWKFMFSSFFL